MNTLIESHLNKPDDGQRFKAELAIRLYAKLGDFETLGPSPDGNRENYPILGGWFRGPGLQGEIIGSGADISVERVDGVTTLHALYRIRTDDNQIIIVDNSGIWRKSKHEGEGNADGFYLRTTPRFIAPLGKYQWLNESIFVGTVDDVEDEKAVLVSCYRLYGI